jgi:4-oxalocrotonate tautomerase
MPYINVRITRDGVTTEQKKQIVEEMTQTLVSVLGKKPEHIHIIIDEVEPENWGFGRNADNRLPSASQVKFR